MSAEKKLAQTALTPPVDELYIVTDRDDKELMLMPLAAVLRQKLFFRLVVLALEDGKERLLLHKNPPGRLPNSGKWDFFTSPVMADEARVDAALRILKTNTDILRELRLVEVKRRPVDEKTLYSLTLFKARLPDGYAAMAAQKTDRLFVDKDELDGLVQGEPGMFSPHLLEVHSWELLFG